MKVKEKIIRQAIKRVDNRIKKLKELIHSNPYSELAAIMREGHQIMEAGGKDYAAIAKKLDPLAKREKVLIKLSESQRKNTSKWITELVDKESQLYDLNNELWYVARDGSLVIS
jgi:hypothetical protein